MIHNAEVEGSIPSALLDRSLDQESIYAYPPAVGGAARKP